MLWDGVRAGGEISFVVRTRGVNLPRGGETEVGAGRRFKTVCEKTLAGHGLMRG